MRKRYIALIIILIILMVIGGTVAYVGEKCLNDPSSQKGIICDFAGWVYSF